LSAVDAERVRAGFEHRDAGFELDTEALDGAPLRVRGGSNDKGVGGNFNDRLCGNVADIIIGDIERGI